MAPLGELNFPGLLEELAQLEGQKVAVRVGVDAVTAPIAVLTGSAGPLTMEGSDAGESGDSVAFVPLGEEVAPDGAVGLRLRAEDFERAQNFGETFGLDIFMRSFNVQVRHL